MKLKHTIQIEIARDAAMKRKQFSDDPQLSMVVIDNYQRQANADLSIAPTSTETLSFGDVDQVKGLYLEVDKEALVRLNGSADAIQLRVGTGVAKFFVEADISEVSVENPDAETLTGVYVCWGDPIP